MVDYYDIKGDLEGIEYIIKLLQNKQFEDVAECVDDQIDAWCEFKFSWDYYDYTDLELKYKDKIYEILNSFI